jgi:hypothetical protein
MRAEVIKPLVMGLALLLLVVYLNANSYKLGASVADWKNVIGGAAAPEVRVLLGDDLVYRQRLKASEIFDAAGQRQISFIRLSGDELARILAQKEAARLVVDGQAVALSAAPDSSMLLAMTTDRMIYLLADDELRSMMTIIWNARHGADGFMQCANVGLCESLHISSRDWGAVDGPYLDTELRNDRRSMPRGRWSVGPQTIVEIESDKQQKVLAMISLLGIVPDQQLAFRGPVVTKAQKLKGNPEPLVAGGKTLYPAAYVVMLDLQPGVNRLEIAYSKWSKPVREGAFPLAAYVTGVKLKLAAE